MIGAFVINVDLGPLGLAFVNTPIACFVLVSNAPSTPPPFSFDAEGWFVGPSVIKATTADLPTQKEIFGPVLSVITYDDVDEALAVAAVRACGLPGWSRWQCVGGGECAVRRPDTRRLSVYSAVLRESALECPRYDAPPLSHLYVLLLGARDDDPHTPTPYSFSRFPSRAGAL